MPSPTRPPHILERFLAWALPEGLEESAVGDLAEGYADMAAEKGVLRARLWYLGQVAKSLAALVAGQAAETWIMMKTAGSITARDVRRNPVYSLITVFGQAVGMACAIVIVLFVGHELSYDRFHKNADRIYRLTDEWTSPAGQTTRTAIFRAEAAAKLAEEFPEIRRVVRITPMNGYVVAHGEKRISVNRYYADPAILDVFTFPLLAGDSRTALATPDSVVLSEEFARQLFGPENPMGRTITLYGQTTASEAQVTGVMKGLPQGSTLRLPVLCPLQAYEAMRPPDQRRRYPVVTYLLLDDRADPRDLEKKILPFVARQLGERAAAHTTFHLQPLTAVHLGAKMAMDLDMGRDPAWLAFLSLAAVVILAIACINSAGLTTARSSRRAREVGLRKAVGAGRGHLVRQFLGEAIAMSFISLFFALLLAKLLLVLFNKTMGATIPFDLTASPWLVPALLALAGLVGVLSGLYPAFYISSLTPVITLKGRTSRPAAGGALGRHAFVIVQFALSVIFLIGMLAARRQMDFVLTQDLGFDKSHVLGIPIFKDAKLAANRALIRRELSGHPAVEDVVVSGEAPGFYGGYPVPCVAEGSASSAGINVNVARVGERYFEFFRIPVLAGRGFSSESEADPKSAVVLNESAVRALGFEEPIGKTVGGKDLEDFLGLAGPARVIGVVKDFHDGNLHETIRPMLYAYEPEGPDSVYVRVRPGAEAAALAFLEERWRKLPTHLPFAYQFIDEGLERFRYADDVRTRRLFTFSAGVALTLACLGIFGLSLLSAERRKKEIGIRKVLGASPGTLVGQMSKDFLKAVLLANIVAWPVGYWVIMRWLGTFAYRAPVKIWLFLGAGGLAFLIAVATVSVEAFRAAASNPVETIRYE